MNRPTILLLTGLALVAVVGGYLAATSFFRDNSVRSLEGVAEFVIPEAYNTTSKFSKLADTPEGQGKALFPDVPETGSFALKPEFTREEGFIGPGSCKECHAEYYEGFIQTAHYRTSIRPSPGAVLGLTDKVNKVTTRQNHLSYEIKRVGEAVVQFLKIRHQGKTYQHQQKIDIVTGSGLTGQTHLYLEEDRLYQLPVSWLASHGWVNSPGYTDGFANFARPVKIACIACHATRVEYETRHVNWIDPKSMILGVTCERCHGPAEAHVDFHRANPQAKEAKHITHPNHLSRERMNDICAQCHSGSADFFKSPFSFRPGDRLEDFLRIDENPDQVGAGVHSANQLPRLKKSQCYTQSDSMNCSTCHNPHQNERDNVALFSKRCMECHTAQDCGQFPVSGEQISKNCIDCHMPKQLDETTRIETRDDSIFPEVRDHFIRIDAEATRAYLKSTHPNK